MQASDFYEDPSFRGKRHKSRVVLADEDLRLSLIKEVQDANPTARVHTKVKVISWQRNGEQLYAYLVNYTLQGVVYGTLFCDADASTSIKLEEIR